MGSNLKGADAVRTSCADAVLASGAPSIARLVRPSEAEVARARRRLHRKACVITALACVSYWSLVFAASGTLLRVVSAAALALGVTAVATGIQHDANHGAFSRSRRVNRLVGCSLDLLGGSSWLWRFKHNVLHHGSTNVVGVDSDIDQAPLARLAPQQPWRRWHRHQHVYLWFVYGVLAIRWFVFNDFANLARNRIATQPLAMRRRRRDVAVLVVGKLAHLTWAIVIPLMLHPWWGVLVFYLASSWCVGFLLAVIFQMAHCNDVADFVLPDRSHRGADFQLHQLATTVDIRCGVPAARWFVRWLMAGLDHQIAHHLAPSVPHTLYGTLSRRVEAACVAHDLPCRQHVSITAALRSHGRWLRLMGQPPPVAMATATPTRRSQP